MTRRHSFEPGVVVIRRGANPRSHCRVCHKPGEQRTRKGSRTVTFWQHDTRPTVEPLVPDPCPWNGMGGLWCCKHADHSGGHHAHRGPRRDVGH